MIEQASFDFEEQEDQERHLMQDICLKGDLSAASTLLLEHPWQDPFIESEQLFASTPARDAHSH